MGENELYKGVEGGGMIFPKPLVYSSSFIFDYQMVRIFIFLILSPHPWTPPLLLVVTKHHENDHLPKLNIYKYESIFCSLTIPDFSFFVSLINRFSSSQTNSI